MNSTQLLCGEPSFWLRMGRVDRGRQGGEGKGWKQNKRPKHVWGCLRCYLATVPSVMLLPLCVGEYICLNVTAWESKYSRPFLSSWTNQSGSLSMEDQAVLLAVVKALLVSHQVVTYISKGQQRPLSWGFGRDWIDQKGCGRISVKLNCSYMTEEKYKGRSICAAEQIPEFPGWKGPSRSTSLPHTSNKAAYQIQLSRGKKLTSCLALAWDILLLPLLNKLKNTCNQK